MSGGLAPSKSTVYVANLPFSLTNNDIHKILEKYGKVVKVTVVKDKVTRRSKGVAFVLFLEKESAHKSVHALNNTQMFGRIIKCSIAKDNGRAPEFIRRKEYKDKSSCYECGEDGHMSYQCPKNLLGEREPPPKKPKKKRSTEYGDPSSEEEEEEEQKPPKKMKKPSEQEEEEDAEESDEGEDPRLETLAAAVKEEQEKVEVEEYRYRVATGQYDVPGDSSEEKRKKYKKDAYFSDEEDLDDD